jgi:sugar phosphate isomerase/epimerase
LDDPPGEEIEAWAARFAHLPVTIHAPFMDLAPGGIDPAVVAVTRRRLVQAAQLTEILGAGTIVAHAGYDYNRYPHDLERWLEVSAETWTEVLAATTAEVVLENVYEFDPDLIARLLARLNHPRLGFCLDVGHRQAWGRAPLLDWLTALRPWLRRLHLHDNDGSFDLHWPIGRGRVEFDRLFGWLQEAHLAPGITLEPYTLDDFRETAAALETILARHPWWLAARLGA